MDRNELISEMEMPYESLTAHLIQKYGPAKYDFFRNEACRSTDPRRSRTAEGLICHHMDEDKAYNLSTPKIAATYPFRCQKADRLVYCNYLEHLLLHIRISEIRHPQAAYARDILNLITPGAAHICNELNTYFETPESVGGWQARCFPAVQDHLDDYILILKRFMQSIDRRYTGIRKTQVIKIGCTLDIPHLGPAKVTGIMGDKLFLETRDEKGVLPRYLADPGDFKTQMQLVRRQLASKTDGSIADMIYDKL